MRASDPHPPDSTLHSWRADMEVYLFFLVILVLAAIADLYAGVANDAVNFLNSGIGSRAGSRKAILTTASLGVLIGATFSGGMLEVARKGIFNPGMFTFPEVMTIFVAVMLADVILLDLYNTYALPTSTTVSLVFEFIGGTVAMAAIKVAALGGAGGEIFAYLNVERVVTIVSSIGLSIVFAFVFGFAIQFLTRVVFTFDYERPFRRFGAVYSALGVTGIVYFVLVKGAKGSALLGAQQAAWIEQNMVVLLAFVAVVLTVAFQVMIQFTRWNVLRTIVFFGTFALALAFAANDLVNFIGAPMAALVAVDIASTSAGDVRALSMHGLADAVMVNPLYLIGAGAVMMITLWTSGKARSVTQTEVSLGRQHEGVERFAASPIARGMVQLALGLHDGYRRLVPSQLRELVARRTDPARAPKHEMIEGEAPSFDLLRASVNLMVASALISVGTAFKLPLSTTFVTFVVAMSTSLADGAWGRESAVFRVNGVLIVIGGWFVTAALAFATCGVFTFIVHHAGVVGVVVLVAVAVLLFVRTTRVHRGRVADLDQRQRAWSTTGRGSESYRADLAVMLEEMGETLDLTVEGICSGKRKRVRDALTRARDLSSRGETLGGAIVHDVRNVPDDSPESGLPSVRAIAATQILTGSLLVITRSNDEYVQNHHSLPDPDLGAELRATCDIARRVLERAANILREPATEELAALRAEVDHLAREVSDFDRRQLKRLRQGHARSRLSLLVIGMLGRVERIAEQALTLAEAYTRESAAQSPTG